MLNVALRDFVAAVAGLVVVCCVLQCCMCIVWEKFRDFIAAVAGLWEPLWSCSFQTQLRLPTKSRSTPHTHDYSLCNCILHNGINVELSLSVL
jgi:hypothetical protein